MVLTELYPWWCEGCETWLREEEVENGQCAVCGAGVRLSDEYKEDHPPQQIDDSDFNLVRDAFDFADLMKIDFEEEAII